MKTWDKDDCNTPTSADGVCGDGGVSVFFSEKPDLNVFGGQEIAKVSLGIIGNDFIDSLDSSQLCPPLEDGLGGSIFRSGTFELGVRVQANFEVITLLPHRLDVEDMSRMQQVKRTTDESDFHDVLFLAEARGLEPLAPFGVTVFKTA